MTTPALVRDEVAQRIRAHLGQAVAGFVAAGRDLTLAKDEFQRNSEFEQWVREQVGISPATASMLMSISAHPTIASLYHGKDLPPSWRTLYELTQLDPPLLEAAIQARRVHPNLERKAARAVVIEYKQIAAQVAFDVRQGDFREALDDLESGSIDAVVTDPPYPADYLRLYSDLAEQAVKWLRPGGVAAVMSGQTHLPEVINRLGEHLDYHWAVAYLTPGGQAVQVFPRKVNTFWKPVLIFTNGPADLDWFGDVAKSAVNDNDKRHHHWGQSESGMADLIGRLTRPGQRILDPFMGAGTTGVAAISLGRSFIGCDVNAEHATTAQERLEQAVLERLGKQP